VFTLMVAAPVLRMVFAYSFLLSVVVVPPMSKLTVELAAPAVDDPENAVDPVKPTIAPPLAVA
jgi:hypothetical protein